MNLLVCKAALKLCRIFKTNLDSNYSGASFDRSMWMSFFNLTTNLLTIETLQLETFSPNKEKFIVRSYGDMRMDGNALLKATWEGLGSNQSQFVPSLVGNFVEVSMTQHKGLRSTSTSIIHSMMEKQFGNTKSLKYAPLSKK